MEEDRIKKYILLTLIPGFGVVSQNRLLKLCGDIDACFSMPTEEIFYLDCAADADLKIGKRRLGIFLRERDSIRREEDVYSFLDSCYEGSISIVTYDACSYPDRYRSLPDKPLVLYIKGNLRINEYLHSAGIIGARRCSKEGKERAILAAEKELARGSAIISGMAKGIDSYAHTAAVLNKGYTIAVLGSGPDICYPKEHRKLYEEIIRDGCVLSEYPPGTEPKAYLFPRRNRLIAGLSDKLYVIDAGRHSGTRTTIDYSWKYGRKVELE